MRKDPNPALEQLITPPIRQITQQRVIETASTFAAVSAIAYRTAVQAAPVGTPTAINWTSEVVDTDSIHDNAVNTDRFTIPSAGVYRIICRLSIDVNAGNLTDFELRVNVNAVEVADEVFGARTTDFIAMIAHEQFLNTGDYYSISVLSSGNSCNILPGAEVSYCAVTKQLV